MADVNITKVYLLNVPLENDYKHTLYFGTADEQKAYFDSLPSKPFTDFSYQRKEGIIRVPIPFDTALKYNYVMYQNTAYSNKWFYAFITDYEFKGEDQTNLTIETDVLQTWMFDYEVLPSFVEREHVKNDDIGLHTIPENLETGEFICVYRKQVESLQSFDFVVGVTMEKNGEDYKNVAGGLYGGIYSGVKYFSCPKEKIDKLNSFIQGYADAGHTDAITCLFTAPKFITGNDEPTGVVSMLSTQSVFSEIYDITNTMPGVDDMSEPVYKPRNNKLHTSPYKYLMISNNNGGSAIYQYEHFQNPKSISFSIHGTLTPGCSIRLIPLDYKKVGYNHEEGLNLGKYPICNWSSDEYTNWLTQNSVNIGISVASGVIQVIGGFASMAMAVPTGGVGLYAGAGAVISGATQISQANAQVHQMQFTPPQSKGNTNCGDVITTNRNNTFMFYGMSIKPEYAKVIDEYFDMFGYKCNRVKIPEKNHRANYWFTKTIDTNLKGNIPKTDLLKIKSCYENGLTFWKNAGNIKNYSVDNSIIK